MKLKKKTKIFIGLFFLPFFLGFSFILSMHYVAMNSGLEGYRGGPQDALRHTLASAYVSRFLGAWSVEVFTKLTERDSESSYDLMDRHNNNIGKLIGQMDKPVFETVSDYIKNGQENSTDPMVIRWLPKEKWGKIFGMK